jgi:fructose-1,6-bisphosphatase I
MTLSEYVKNADLASLVETLAGAGRAIAREVQRAALSGHTGYSGGENESGDRQKKLDVIGNDLVLDAFRRDRRIAAIVSEEDDDPVPTDNPKAPYVLCTDPIDGSSNTDTDGPLGTIFSFSRRRDGVAFPRGADIAMAGYVLYGPSTILAFSAGDGATAFTLDTETNAWVQTHPQLRCPERGKTFSANLGRSREWHPHLRAYLDWLMQDDPQTSRPFSLRYIGALCADLHRCFIEGGLYFYPPDAKNRNGKLRLMYELLPLAFLAEQAGAKASTGERRVLEVEAKTAHERAPLVIGSARDVTIYETFLRKGTAE